MKIEPYINNPIVKEQSDYDKLRQMLEEVEPDLFAVYLYPDKMRIVNIAERTFIYPKTPTMEWVIKKVRYMKSKNL